MDKETAMWIKEEETDVVHNEPGPVFLQDLLTLEEPNLYVKQEIELKLAEDDSEQKVQVYPSSVNVKEEMEDGLNQEVHVYPSSVNVKKEMDDGVNQEFLEDPLCFENPGLHIKQEPELDLDVDGSEHNVQVYPSSVNVKEEMEDGLNQEMVASRCYASNSTRLFQSNERCNFPVEEPVRQGVSHNELEIGSEESPHFIMFHEGEEEEKEKEERLTAPKLKCSLRENKCQTFTCSFCLQSFTSKYRLMKHVFVHIDGVEPPKSVCKSCAEVFPSNVSLKKHLRVSEAEQESCADKEGTFVRSGKSFTHLGTLKSHASIHTGTNSHKCDICGKSFTLLNGLNRHSLIHTGIKPHNCDICGKAFTFLFHLKNLALIHTGRKPYKCDICGKSFTYCTQLKSHSSIHTGTKPYMCDICGKSFSRFSSLKSHALIHTGTTPYKCDICGKSYTELGSLKRHSLIHTGTRPHNCDICGKSFTQLSRLKSHALIHTGTRPHRFDICGKSFIHLGTLKTHALIHTGIKPRKCEICGKAFTLLSHRKIHALLHTKQNPPQV